MIRPRIPSLSRVVRLARVAAAAGAVVVSVALAATLAACEGTPAASQVTVIAGEQHLTFSPGPEPSGPPPSPPVVAFSTQPAGGSEEQDIEFRAGTASLTVASVELKQVVGPRDFFIVSESCSARVLAPGQACTVKVRFAPLATGPQGADLVFNLGQGVPPLRLNLEGAGSKGGDPTITPTPTPTKPTPTPTPTKATPKSTGVSPSPSPAKSWIFMK